MLGKPDVWRFNEDWFTYVFYQFWGTDCNKIPVTTAEELIIALRLEEDDMCFITCPFQIRNC